MSDTLPFQFVCPVCKAPLEECNREELSCPSEGAIYRRVEGIWRFLPTEFETKYLRFIRDYETVRRFEGRGSPDPAYYRSLPGKDITGRFDKDWRIRMRSYQSLVEKVIAPLEQQASGGMRTLDIGAGNGWLSYQLARRGHAVAAVDLLTNALDGLGTNVYYDRSYTPIQADFDHLPFQKNQFDFAIFNASFHYSTDYENSLRQTLPLLKKEGRLVIMDSPLYHAQQSGKQMVQEREQQFHKAYGFPSNSLPSENFLTFDRLANLERELSIHWELIYPSYGLGWALRPWKAMALRQREPAQFCLIVGKQLF